MTIKFVLKIGCLVILSGSWALENHHRVPFAIQYIPNHCLQSNSFCIREINLAYMRNQEKKQNQHAKFDT